MVDKCVQWGGLHDRIDDGVHAQQNYSQKVTVESIKYTWISSKMSR